MSNEPSAENFEEPSKFGDHERNAFAEINIWIPLEEAWRDVASDWHAPVYLPNLRQLRKLDHGRIGCEDRTNIIVALADILESLARIFD